MERIYCLVIGYVFVILSQDTLSAAKLNVFCDTLKEISLKSNRDFPIVFPILLSQAGWGIFVYLLLLK